MRLLTSAHPILRTLLGYLAHLIGLQWLDHFLDSLLPEHGVNEGDLAQLKNANADFHAKLAAANHAAAVSKQATAEKTTSRQQAESLVRAEVRRIKARSNYTAPSGMHLGIEAPSTRVDLSHASPKLSAVDQADGSVAVSFNKYDSDGVNIYGQRDNDSNWQLLGCATVSPFIDNRSLLQAGKPELRRYSAIFVLKDKEVGKFSNEVVLNCSP